MKTFRAALEWLGTGRRALYVNWSLTALMVVFAALSWPGFVSLFLAFSAGFSLAVGLQILQSERSSAQMVELANQAFAEALDKFEAEHGPLIPADAVARIFFGRDDDTTPKTRH